ncbi:YtxH domain-containing protein [Oxynema aestuarii]|jgi:gas vesicle protein|uniref:YtxH domain-containing protein n=1 Tax=Oxynema aestuarii AP17 TaxID=2064643 RepID=A0A6H1U4N1_9CYAN|nr:YtxH domain-containing protein [Oxynema aestuarii]QIZ73110.1 YtxH domain-containing protein [Oxynema aestuarii AP17]RMH75459.1 MAG: YtxH domain-containing protein [Cyanobacteria bacterium J007]
MSKNRTGAFIGGVLLGTAIGTITGLLVAPRSGRKTRQLVKKSAAALPELAEDLSSTLQLQADRLSAKTLRNWDETLVRLREAIASGIEASQLEKEQLDRQNREDRPDPEEDPDNEFSNPSSAHTTQS